MCYFSQGVLWQENGAGLQRKAESSEGRHTTSTLGWSARPQRGLVRRADNQSTAYYGTEQPSARVLPQGLKSAARRKTRQSRTSDVLMTAVIKHSQWRLGVMMISVFVDVGMKGGSEQRRTYHLGAVFGINRHVFVPTDTLLKWNETSWGDKALHSVRVETSKYHLGGFPFSLWSLLVWRGPDWDNSRDWHADRSCQGLFLPPVPVFFFGMITWKWSRVCSRVGHPDLASLVLLMHLSWGREWGRRDEEGANKGNVWKGNEIICWWKCFIKGRATGRGGWVETEGGVIKRTPSRSK